jgi:hypothetical protein
MTAAKRSILRQTLFSSTLSMLALGFHISSGAQIKLSKGPCSNDARIYFASATGMGYCLSGEKVRIKPMETADEYLYRSAYAEEQYALADNILSLWELSNKLIEVHDPSQFRKIDALSRKICIDFCKNAPFAMNPYKGILEKDLLVQIRDTTQKIIQGWKVEGVQAQYPANVRKIRDLVAALVIQK